MVLQVLNIFLINAIYRFQYTTKTKSDDDKFIKIQ